MEKKRKLSLGDKIYVIEKKYGEMVLCPTCAHGSHEEMGYEVEEVVVERLEYTCEDDYGYRNILINQEHVTGNGQDFYYTKKEANKFCKLRNNDWKKRQQRIKESQDQQKSSSNNPVKGLPLTLYPIKGK